MSLKFSEQEMVIKFCKFLEKKKRVFAVEVPFFSRSIDLVFTEDEEFCAVEFKLRNWRKAILQAKFYMLGADFVFICIPLNIYNKQIKKEASENNCGLILFDEEKEKFKIIKNTKQKSRKGRFLIKNGFDYAYNNDNYNYLLSLS